MSSQIYFFEEWVKSNNQKFDKKLKYVADIGFDVRVEATCGGTFISLEMMKSLIDLNMEIYLSEYFFSEEQQP